MGTSVPDQGQNCCKEQVEEPHKPALEETEHRQVQADRTPEAVDEAIMATVAADASLQARLDILVSIPGVSQIAAFTLIIEMPELGELDEKAAAALSGLAP